MAILRQTQDDLPATVRVAQERMLDALLKAKGQEETNHREKKLAKKYRMVKFFGKCYTTPDHPSRPLHPFYSVVCAAIC